MERTDGLQMTRAGAVAVWTLDRPARRNAFDGPTLEALARAIDDLQRDEALRAAVLTGSGERAFCAGADLVERRAMSVAEVSDRLERYDAVFGALDACRKPVVAAVNGTALGGGFELALACDLRVMAAGATLALPEVGLGVIPGAGGTQRLTKLVGEARAKQVILLGDRLSAERALAWGLVAQVAASAAATRALAVELAEALAAKPPIAVEAALEAVDHARDLPLADGIAAERRCYERTLHSEDRLEALAAFAEKRPPVFKGR